MRYFIQKKEGNWLFCCSPEYKWLTFSLKSATNITSAIKQQLNCTEIINITKIIELTNKNTHNTIILLSSNSEEEILNLFPQIKNSTWVVNESIDKNGNIISELSEPEINKALRHIFALKPKLVHTALINSIFNPIHERSLINILNTAGIKAIGSNTEK